MAQNNGSKWDKNFIVALLSFIAAVLALVVAITTPELRNCFGLKDSGSNTPAPASTPAVPAPLAPAAPQPEPKAIPPKMPEASSAKPAAAPKPKPPVLHKEVKEPAGPYNCTIGENKSEFVKEAKTSLSVTFHNIGGEETASVTIAPAGKEEITLPTVGSGSQEFASSTGVFLVHILNVDWNSRTVTVQVSRKL